eukprot:9467865-Pyramimonas_sp.AAC.1
MKRYRGGARAARAARRARNGAGGRRREGMKGGCRGNAMSEGRRQGRKHILPLTGVSRRRGTRKAG